MSNLYQQQKCLNVWATLTILGFATDKQCTLCVSLFLLNVHGLECHYVSSGLLLHNHTLTRFTQVIFAMFHFNVIKYIIQMKLYVISPNSENGEGELYSFDKGLRIM